MPEKMYGAWARHAGSGMSFVHVTLFGEMFFANRGLLEDMIALSLKKHPTYEFEIREVPYA